MSDSRQSGQPRPPRGQRRRAPVRPGSAMLLLAAATLLLLTAVPRHDTDPDGPTGATPAAALARIEAAQQRIAARDLRWQAGATGISHLTPTEFSALLGAIPPSNNEWEEASPTALGLTELLADEDGLPERWDWRDQGGVTPARHQGACGGCWAFAAAGALEGLLKIYDGVEHDLSEQQVLDCNTAGYGCDGGWMTAAYRLWKQQGAVAEALIPYRAEDDGACPTDGIEPAAGVSGWTPVASTQAALKRALLVGPIAAGMHVYPDFQHYRSGVYEHEGSDEINHAVLLVGWDDERGAWILKNSWGQTWGEQGFAYVAYGSCRLGSYPHRVLVPTRRPLRIDHEPLTDLCDGDGPLELRWIAAAAEAPLDPGTVRLMLDLGSGFIEHPFQTLALDDGAGIYSATLERTAAGARVRYFIEAHDEHGGAVRLPEEGAFVFRVLRPVFADDFEEDRGWLAGSPDDDAVSGLWELGRPALLVAEGGLTVQPDGGRAPGEQCYATGLAAGDVDGGRTSLTSPAFALAGYEVAVLECWLWFSNQLGQRPYEDSFLVEASGDDGATWAAVLEIREGAPEWRRLRLELHAAVALTDQVRVRFVARDLHQPSVIKAMLDDVRLLVPAALDAPPPPTLPAGLALSLGANPSRGGARLAFSLPAPGPVTVEIADVSGRSVASLWRGDLAAGSHAFAWDGRTAGGTPAPAGRYWVRVTTPQARSVAPLTLLR